MPPKRRKLSLEDCPAPDKRNLSDIDADSGLLEKFFTSRGDRLPCTAEKDGRKTKSKTAAEILSAEFKASNEAPKPTRISERLIIKRNRLWDPEETDIAGSGVSQSQTTPKKPKPARQRKKTKRRPWAQWSVRDKILFFNGLGEFGKNFEAISNKISHAARLRGLPVKDKMQVRYFYYRCWSKISKFIHLNDNGVKMKVPELYGLINYGVLKKHVKETDPQFGRCLNELILKGETTYTARNVRGKRMRVGKIRTPVCTYLKKINRIEDKKASDVAGTHKMPHQIMLELTPKNSRAWAKVQGMSHNPRLRFRLTTNRSLESVFQYLEKKWKSRRVRLKQSLGVTEEGDEELALFLHPSCHITDVILIPQEQQKVDVTFTSYRENILPTLKKPKKSKHAKEMEKSFSEKEKLKEDAAENLATTSGKYGSEVREICAAPMSSAEADTAAATEHPLASATLEPESIFTKHLTSCLGNQASFSQKDTTGSGNFADATLGSISPAVLMEDENAMFPDSSPFSDQMSASGEGSGKSTTPPSPPPADQPCSILIPPVILSPTVSKKKSTKYCKKALSLEDNLTPFDNCDGKMAASGSDHSSSPSKTDSSASAWEELKDNLEKDITRITNLAKEGFVAKTASNVTLLHLSLILGRASVIKLEYEWKPKRLPKVQPPAFLNQAAIQMSNVLRRLCNLATLELADLAASERIAEQNKSSVKNVPCSNCHRSSKLKNKRHGHSESKEIATMTDPIKMECTPLMPVFQPAALLAANNRTFVASTSSPTTVQIAGPDPVFRVPVVPSVKPAGPSTEEQQREQMQANAIMQQGVSLHNKLLKRRPAQLRNRKAPPIVVQRTLLPKVDAGQMVTFVQQPVVAQSVSSPLVVEVPPNQLMKVTQPLASGPSLASHPQLIELSPNQLLKLTPSGLPNHIILEVPPDSMGVPQPLASPTPVIVMSGDPAPQVSQPVVSSSMVLMSSDQVLMSTQLAASSSPLVVSSDQVVMVSEPAMSGSLAAMSTDQVLQGVQTVVSSSMGLDLSPRHNVIMYSQTGDPSSTLSFTADLDGVSGNGLSNSVNLENGMLSELVAASNEDPRSSQAAVRAIGSTPELQLSMSSRNVFSANLFSSSPETEPPLRTSAVSALSATGDITISDLDISLSSVIVGAESGDKFLDMILQNSEQGFSGLISTPKKSAATPVTFNSLSSPSMTTFDPAGLRTPPRISRPAYLTSSLFQTPIKLGMPSQAWISSEDGDLSLGSVVGESPVKDDGQKSTSNASVIPTSIGFFGTVSSSMPDRSSSIFSKPSSASELSLSSLLTESVFKKDDTLDVSPPISLSSDTDLRADNHVGGFFGMVGTPHLFSEVSTDSLMKLEDDKALQSVVNESSLDLVSKFELLANQIAGQVERDASMSRDKQEPSLGVWAPKCG